MSTNQRIGGDLTYTSLDNKKYEVSLITEINGSKIELQIYNTQKKHLLFLHEAKEITKEELNISLRACRDEYLCGKFNLQSEIGAAFIQSAQNLKWVLALLFKLPEEEMNTLYKNEQAHLIEFFDLIIRESYGLDKEVTGDPKPVTDFPAVEKNS